MLGGTLGAYRIDAALGSGGMGRVWRATVVGQGRGVEPGTVVALKVLHPHLLETPGFAARFQREAQLGRAVVHANVVRTIDSDSLEMEGRKVDFLVMEYVEGQTLRDLLHELERVPEELCRHIGREVARGLAAIHAAGIVHRDVKPENVLITAEHEVKVMDLGVARIADEAVRLSQSGAFVGSVQYAAPEQFAKGMTGVDTRADLHALGLILYELATAQHPYQADDFRGVMRRVLDEKPRRPAEIDPQLSPFFEEVVLRLLAKKPERRFASAAEVARILDEGEASPWWSDRSTAIRVETRRPLRRIRIPRETTLYGREPELAHLRAAYERAKAGEGQAVLVEGEAGIGKSRLVDEFVGLVRDSGEDVNFLFGSYPPGGAATASGGFSTAYREQFGEDGSAGYLTETPILVPAFDALLRGEPPPVGSEPLTKDSLQSVFVHATRHLAAERPTIVLIDDLHFAPEEGRALFAALALAVPGHRVLLVGTTRPGFDEKWTADVERVGVTRLALSRLGAKDLVRLLADTLRSAHLAEELAGRIAVKSDGNPFFVFEILRGLREGQFLTRKDDGTWATTQVIREITIPSSVLDLVNARVADLDEDERNMLDVAACVGFEFDATLVGEAAGLARIPALRKLALVERRHRLVRAAGERYVFDHHQVQEALYGSLSAPLRREYHAAIAGALERRHGAQSRQPGELDGALAVELAEHLLKGGEGARALRYLGPALTHLEKGYLSDAAVRLAERALAAEGLIAGGERCRLLLRRAGRLELLGRAAEEEKSLLEAISLADAASDPVLRAAARSTMGRLLRRISRNAEARFAVTEAIALFREIGDRRGEARATGNLGLVLRDLGRYDEARALHDTTIALCREVGDLQGEASATGGLGLVFRALGRHDESRTCHERALELAREMGHRRGEATEMGNLGNVFFSLGHHDEARTRYEWHLALSREIGFRQGEAVATGNLGNLFFSLGRYEEARTFFERHLTLSREMGYRSGEAIALVNLHLLQGELGEGERARAALETDLALCRELGIRYLEVSALLGLGETAARTGREVEALRPIETSLALCRETGQRDGVADALLARGRLRSAAGDTAGAREDLAEAASIGRELSLPAVTALCAAHAAALPDGDVGAALAALAAHEARLGVRERMEARIVLWRATRDPVHVAKARRLLDFLVAHAPEGCRESMVTNVRLHREIAAAAKAAAL